MGNGLAAVERFIAEHALHNSIPVDLAVFDDLYDVWTRFLDDGLMGMVLTGESGTIITISMALEAYACRAVLAHEAAHVILEHPNSLYVCRLNGWLHQRYEREAQQAAAMILIPRAPLIELALSGATVREMVETFRVPEELIELQLRSVLAA